MSNARTAEFPNSGIPLPAQQIGPLNVFSLPSSYPQPPNDASDSLSSGGIEWLLKDSPDRRKHPCYKHLVGCVKRARQSLGLTKKCDPKFGIGVFEAMAWYNKIRWPGSLPLDRDNYSHRIAVSKVLALNIRNCNYYQKKLETNKARSGDESSDPQVEDAPDNIDEDVTNGSSSHPLKLAKNDTVFVIDEKQTVKFVGIVHNPFLTEEVLDFNRVEVKVLKAVSDSSIAGDILVVSLNDIIYFPAELSELQSGVNQDSQCKRGADCRPTAGSLVLMDLEAVYSEHWPLVGLIKSVNASTKKMSIDWLWLNGEEELGVSALEGQFEPWVQNGKVVEQTVSIACHYFCRFQLEQKRLPQCARAACEQKMNQN